MCGVLCVTLTDAILGVNIFPQIEEFSRFSSSFVTLFRIVAGETWLTTSENFPMFVEAMDGSTQPNFGPVFFVGSIILLFNWTLLQMTMALLIDFFIKASENERAQIFEARIQEFLAQNAIVNPLEPLLKKLIRGYTDDKDLQKKLVMILLPFQG